MQFVAGQRRVQVTDLEQVLVLNLRAGDLVVVVRDVDFLLAHQFPVVAIRSTVEHVGIVGGTQAIGGSDRRVVCQVRRTTHATLTGVVTPGLARFLDLIQGLVNQHRTTGQTRRAGGEGQVVEHDVVQVGEGAVLHVVLEHGLLLRGHQRVGTIALYRHFRGTTHDVGTTITGDVVPQRFHAVLRNRERDAAIGIGEAVAAVDQLGAGGVLDGVVIDPLRRRAGATGLVDRHLVGFRVGLEHGDLTRRQVGLVLAQVGRGDGEQRLVFRERVDVMLARAGVTGRCLGDTTGPGRDGAGGIAGFLGAEGRQGVAEFGSFLRGNGSQCRAGGKRQRNGYGHQPVLVQHG